LIDLAKGLTVAGSEPVTSPDQLKLGHRRAGRIGGVITIVLLLAMMFGNHDDADSGLAEDLWLIGFASLIAVILIADVVLRRNGIRS
jgi:Protein of unknown function (DUF2631)